MSDNRVRLTLVADSDVFGGAEAYLLHLLRHLPPRFAPVLLVTDHVPAQLLSGAAAHGVPVVHVAPVRSKRDVGRLIRLWRALAATRADVVHVNQAIPANNRHAIALAAWQRRGVLVTLHLTAQVVSAQHRRRLRALYARLHRAIAVSQRTRAQLCDELGVAPARVRVVPNGVDMRQPVVPRDLDDGVLRIAALGRLVPQKGFDVLIEAVRLLQRDGVCVEVRIAGDGAERATLQAAAGDVPVELVPFVDDAEAFLRAADVFCLPSRDEGLPFALLEAMMLGLPCVATDVGDVALALQDSAGMVVPAEDPVALAAALRELHADPQRRRALAAAARERAVAVYSVENMVAQTVAVYDEVLAGR